MSADAWAPACMDAADYADWSRLNGKLWGSGMKADRPCDDCLPAFAAEMRSADRCNGTPKGSAKEEPVETPTPRADRRIPVALVLPCTGCAHQLVCRIAPSLEGLTTARTDLPAFDDAITMQMVARVECAHYSKGSRPKAAAEPKAEGRKLDLSPEERERRRARLVAMNEARRSA